MQICGLANLIIFFLSIFAEMSVLLSISYLFIVSTFAFLLLLLFVLLASTIVDQQYTNLSYLDLTFLPYRILSGSTIVLKF